MAIAVSARAIPTARQRKDLLNTAILPLLIWLRLQIFDGRPALVRPLGLVALFQLLLRAALFLHLLFFQPLHLFLPLLKSDWHPASL